MKAKLLTIFILTLFTSQTYSQTEYKKHIKTILTLSIIDSSFIFNTSDNPNQTVTTTLTYLGTTNRGDKVLYITETYPASATRHGFRWLYIIDNKDTKYFYRDIDKPTKMTNGVLKFKHADKNGKSYFADSDLNKEIPKFICVDKDDCYDYQIDE